jgi:hypothetical protein
MMSDDRDIVSPIELDKNASGGSNSITEHITVPFSADMTKSQQAKIMRQVANILHALLANAMRYAAIGDGNNLGAGHQIYQQTYAAAGNADAVAMTLEQSMKQVLTGQLPPPPGGKMIGRA